MRITVIGGNHGTGAQFVEQAAAAGHEVTSVSRTAAEALPPGVAEHLADARDPAAIAEAVTGADAVVVTVGGASGTDRNRAAVTQGVITAMQAAGVRRLVAQSSMGVGDSMDLLVGPARLFAKAILGKALADHAEQEAAVQASGLDWTILRPGGLTDGPATGNYIAQVTAGAKPMKSRISRADLATYALSILDDPAANGLAFALGTP